MSATDGQPVVRSSEGLFTKPEWSTTLQWVLRIALIIVGIPLIWIFRADLHWSVLKAVGASGLLVLLAMAMSPQVVGRLVDATIGRVVPLVGSKLSGLARGIDQAAHRAVLDDDDHGPR